MLIAVLTESVVSKIAAGEVVERPASVVKELLENALDSGARRINVEVEGGGRQLVRVADDGAGIPAAEAELAFARHATSKLRSAGDLDGIETLGFRGEALASIAAVSRVRLVTRAPGEQTGTRLLAEAGNISDRASIGAPRGTVVSVENLFFNVPARLKFLKSDAAEKGRIARVLSRYALAYPAVRFLLHFDNRQAFQSHGTGNLRDVLVAAYGAETAGQMLELSGSEQEGISVHGFVSPPGLSRSNRREITLFVNGRYVHDAQLGVAVTRAYHTLLMTGRYPIAVLSIALPPGDVDVNVHPAKTEVRFRQRNRVFRAVEREVRRSLLNQAPVQSATPSGWAQTGAAAALHWQEPVAVGTRADEAPAQAADSILAAGTQAGLPVGGVPLLRVIGQVGAAYIVAEGPDGLYLIDQHAAHERILYEAFMAAAQGAQVESQTLLQAATVTLASQEAEDLRHQLDALQGLGFEVEPFGGDSFVVRALPAVLGAVTAEQALRGVVEHDNDDGHVLPPGAEARIITRVCKRAAVRAGQVLSHEEQAALLRRLEKCLSPRTCPHGRPTMIHLSVETLQRQFGRKG